MTRARTEEAVAASPGSARSVHSRRHFSMIREFALADFLTLGNGAMGFGSALSTSAYLTSGDRMWLWVAMALLPVAVTLDALDGRVARWRRRSSAMGMQLDSLADLISFAVAPALIAFAAGMRGGWDALVLVFFVIAGLSRLARYNVTASRMEAAQTRVTHFEGLPIPSSIVLVAIIAALTAGGRIGPALPLGSWSLGPADFHPFVLLFAAWGIAMISRTLRVPKP